MKHSVAVAAAWALVAAAACDTATEAPPSVATLEVVGDTVLRVGESRTLQAVARAADGQVLAGTPVAWASLDTVAAVDDGLVTGMAVGDGRIVARAESATDTFALRVAHPEPGPGEANGRVIEGESVADVTWTGWTQVLDVLAGADGDRSTLLAGNEGVPGLRDTLVAVFIPGTVQAGRFAVDSFPLVGGVAAGPVAYIAFGDDARRFYYSTAGGELELTEVAYPEAAGWTPGSVRGAIRFRGAHYLVGPGGGPVASGDTVQVMLEFNVVLQHRLLARVEMQVAGGPVEGAPPFLMAHSSNEPSGLLLWWDADFDLVPQAWRFEAQQAVQIAHPAVQSFALDSVTAAEYTNGPWPAVFSAIHYRDDSRVALSSGGTVTITRYLPATQADFGEVHGVVDARMRLWAAGDTVPGDAMTAATTFAIPINPGAGAFPDPVRTPPQGSPVKSNVRRTSGKGVG